jgi:carboxyl-terminal processing protease
MAVSVRFEPKAGYFRSLRACFVALCLLPAAASLTLPAWPAAPATQGFSKFDRDQGRMMLKRVKEDLTSYYYDPTFHGVSVDEVFAKADDAIAHADSHAQIFSAIAGALHTLDDSHTFFVPPAWSAKIEYGWGIRMVGDRCYVDAVQPGSDAEAQQLKRGDLVLSIDGEPPTRAHLLDMIYDQRLLAPRGSSLLVVKPPSGRQREVIVHAKVTPGKRVLSRSADLSDAIRELKDEAYLNRHRFEAMGEEMLIWKMPEFNMNRDDVGRVVTRARKQKCLVVDLRGNPGGSIETVESMVGGFVGDKAPIADVKSRLKLPPMVSRKMPSHYEGKLVVLIDSDSASSSEIFARAMQLSGRGTVLGDHSSGSVMMARHYDASTGSGGSLPFGSSITIADVIMSDGQSLEKAGVTPDELLLPTAEDLANNRDPVLSRAAAICGVTLDPERAGALFPIEWER